VRGRPRSEKSRDAILEATFVVLRERGYDGLSIERVAAAALAGKATIYRWWPSKAELAVDAFFHATKDELVVPDTGSAAQDFRQQIMALAALLRDGRGAVLAAMLGGARTDPLLARALGERWLAPRRAWGTRRMLAAVAAGDCHEGIDPQAALAVLYGPLYTPLLFGRPVPSVHQVRAVLAIAMSGIFRPSARSGRVAETQKRER